VVLERDCPFIKDEDESVAIEQPLFVGTVLPENLRADRIDRFHEGTCLISFDALFASCLRETITVGGHSRKTSFLWQCIASHPS